jgi:molybdopterin molybdotransferase
MDRVPVEQHAARVRELLAPLLTRGTESVSLADALGRVTSAPVVSPIDLPPFRNSQMDGFAVFAADVATLPATLPIAREVAAAPGDAGSLQPGTAIRIMTGAPVPEGADAVIPVEDTSLVEEGAEGTRLETTVQINRGRAVGDYIREAGSDLRAGAGILPAATRLASRHLAALAASGLAEVLVTTRVSVAVVSTGSELVEPGTALGPGQIPDANGIALGAAVRAAGAELVASGRVFDEPATLAALFDRVIAETDVDLLITSGGISMGDHEVVRELLEPLGAEVGTVNMQPGGPQALATYRGIPVVCFPGNPVSSQLSFELFVAPLLRELAGLPAKRLERHFLQHSITSIPGRRQYLRGRRLPENRVETVAGPGSHLVAALAASNVLIVIPENAVDLAAGESVETLAL